VWWIVALRRTKVGGWPIDQRKAVAKQAPGDPTRQQAEALGRERFL